MILRARFTALFIALLAVAFVQLGLCDDAIKCANSRWRSVSAPPETADAEDHQHHWHTTIAIVIETNIIDYSSFDLQLGGEFRPVLVDADAPAALRPATLNLLGVMQQV